MLKLNLDQDEIDILITALHIYAHNNQTDIEDVNPEVEPAFHAFALKRKKQIKKMQKRMQIEDKPFYHRG